MVEHAGGQGQLANGQVLRLKGRIVLEGLLKEGRGRPAGPESLVCDNPAQEMAVGGHAEHGCVLKRADQPPAGFIPVLAPGNYFCQHRVVVGSDSISRSYPGIKP